MSKTTKIIAALGVVAGLGVAALPAFTFAEGEPSVSGDVEVLVDVLPAIAMTISGNNDGGTHLGGTFSAVANPEGDPSQLGYLELNNDGHYVKSTDTSVDGEKTYYQFTAHVQGDYHTVSTYAPGNVTGAIDSYTIPDTTYTATSSTWTSILPNAVVNGDASAASPINNFGSIITVYTNNTSGYTLTLKDADTVTDLTHTTGEGYIPTQGSALQAGTAGWNLDVTRVGSETPALTNQAVPASNGTALTVDSLGTKTTNGRVVKVDYNVATAADQATGTYTDTIVYTATCQ